MKLLLHICCSCCFAYPYQKYKQNGVELTGYWYNPNIHPFTEYRRRLESLKKFAEENHLSIAYDESYDLAEFLRGALRNLDDRCGICYISRLRKAASYAKEKGFDSFSTTLLVSPHQNHALVKDAGETVANEIGVSFYYQDLREGFGKSREISKEKGLYSQKYCGCIFSEKERYLA